MIDGFIRNFDEWWLLGTRDYSKLWAQNFDSLTNQFVLEGAEGGLLTLVLFVVLLVLGFRGVGHIARSVGESRFRQVAAWMLGAALFAHCASFIAVSYFGQIVMLLYLTLAAIASLSPTHRRFATARSRASRHSLCTSERRFSEATQRPVSVRTCRNVEGSLT